jgi:hypothetical protein
MDERLPKVFGIGLNKTGTTTLGKCGLILGYRCMSFNRSLLEDVVLKKNYEKVKKITNCHNFFEDWPWPLIYKELDEMYPGSKFILTYRRDERIWLESLKRHSLNGNPKKHCRKLAYGYNYPHSNERFHMDFYKKHNDSVRSYFKNRIQDFLEICWEKGDGWKKLCNFLGKETPSIKVPHEMKGSNRRVELKRIEENMLFMQKEKSMTCEKTK